MESIVATTKVAAEWLGWDDRLGTLAAGKLADVVVVKGDPLANVRVLKETENVAWVMKDGVVVKDLLG